MRVLVTGATGFVGQALVQRMLQEGWRVRCAVRTVSDLERLPRDVEAVAVGPIDQETTWTPLLTGVDMVVHLAARTHMTREGTDVPLSAYRLINVASTEHLARAAADAGVKRFIYLSSVKVNGEGRAEPYTEEDPPAPEEAYGISKWEAEKALHSIAGKTGMEIVIIRPPLVYGPGVKANFLQMMRIIRKGMPLPLASIDNQRSFVYLENLLDAVVSCMVHPKAVNQTYLVSDGEDVSTPQLVRCTAAALGRPARLFPCAPSLLRLSGKLTGRSKAIDRLLGSLTIDSSKIRTELGWAPSYSMEQGLRETAEWFKRQY